VGVSVGVGVGPKSEAIKATMTAKAAETACIKKL
jgi:hypothetical protein